MRAKDVRGRLGEDLAAAHLIAQGLIVLDRNWRCAVGEVDIVAREGDALVICEVKTRSSRRFGSPLEAVTPSKAARLKRLAACWVRAHHVRPQQIRIDLVGIVLGHSEPEIEHVRGAVG
ncbi:MAG: YraN family protein [Actinomycetes bacterium]